MKIIITCLTTLFCCIQSFSQQAELHINNNSGRILMIKVIKDNQGSPDYKYSTLSIQPYSNVVEYFSQTGNYYLKTKAIKNDKDPIYEKGNPFEVYVGRDGYSVLTITYSITESNTPNPLEGKRISKAEFDKD